MAALRLQPASRDFFDTVAETAFCNPFNSRRTELDAKIVGHAVAAGSEAHMPELTQAVASQLQKLGAIDVRKFAGEERKLVQTAVLFHVFHLFHRKFDDLIMEQVKAGLSPLPVKFASDALAELRRHGIGSTESVRFLGIFYQLRRAYHFIVRGLVGDSASMAALRRHLWNNVFTQDVRLYDEHLWNRMEDFSTLLLGETGTGKGAAAAAIGRSGFIPFDEKHERFTESFIRSFISLNLSQFPETLIESELFGHRKGAFTGAVEAHEGVLARCSPHGAIFLDEIGDVSVPVQIKLLQVLQERTFSPVGSHERVTFRGRVIAATNRPLETLRSRKLFRDDFFYRLCSDVIHVPPLRQRLSEDPGELRQLLEHLLTRILGSAAADLIEEVEQKLRASVGDKYPWPGNVRELEQAVRRILLTGSYAGSSQPKATLTVEELINGIEAEALDADALLAGYCRLLYESSGNFEDVARRTNLDRRTVKKYLHLSARQEPEANAALSKDS